VAQNKLTLLELVQDILNDMSADSVNSISDTEESLQVAQIVRTVYVDFLTHRDRPWLRQLFQLEAPTDDMVTRMKIPDDYGDIVWLKYDKRLDDTDPTKFSKVEYKEPAEFIDMMVARDSTSANIDAITDPTSGIPFLIYNDRHPAFWTSLDDTHIVFDAYDSDLEANLQTSKTLCYGHQEAAPPADDDDVPDMPSELFSEFLAKAKATAFYVLKQAQNPAAERTARHGETRSQYAQWRTHAPKSRHHYGRK